jgi:hypothetical protein
MDYVNLSQIRSKTTSSQFKDFSTKEANDLLLAANNLINASSKPPDMPIYQDIEQRINSHIQTKVNRCRCRIQLSLSLLILIIAAGSFIHNFYPSLLGSIIEIISASSRMI